MTDHDERLEAVAKALRTLGYRPVGDPAESDAEDFLAMLDAARAFDEQRKLCGGSDHAWDEASQRCQCGYFSLPAASPVGPVGADPPWLYRARTEAVEPIIGGAISWADQVEVVRSVLRFAAAQPPSAEEIKVAGKEIIERLHLEDLSLDTEQRIASAALLAAARVRAGG